jgi:uncharacterized membrane protein
MLNSFYHFLEKLGYSHPIHPMVTHLTVGLTMGTLVFALVSVIFRKVRLKLTAWHCAILAAVSVVPTAGFGIMDWQYHWKGIWLPTVEGKTILAKMILAGALFVCLLVGLLLVRRREGESEDAASHPWRDARSIVALILYGLSTAIVITLGFLGGNLVYG